MSLTQNIYCAILIFLIFYTIYGENFVGNKLGGGESYVKLVESCQEGFIRGSISGFVTGGPTGAFLYGAMNGVLNPFMEYMKGGK